MTEGNSSQARDWIEIIATPLQVAPAVQFVSDAAAGGIDLFLGTTRAEKSVDGRELIALDYEAYPEMALTRMRLLVERARAQWPIVKVAMLHRVGRVALAEPSVIIAVSCPHRGESFAACKWLIDQLKIDVPIWKKEMWGDGTGTWVNS
jgi:molybdopterin synthase catalytic subunit